MGRGSACQGGLLQVECSKIPCEVSVAGFSPGEKEGARLRHVSQRMCRSWGTEAGAGGKLHWMPQGPSEAPEDPECLHWSRSRMGKRKIQIRRL